MRRAFTLLELLLVLAIIALGAGVVASRLGGMRTTQAVDQAAQQVLDQAWRCRQLATAQGRPQRLRLEAAARTVTVQTLTTAAGAGGASLDAGAQDPPDALPVVVGLYEGAEDLSATLVRDDGVTAGEGPLDLLFLPDGTCSPAGVLTLACAGRTAALRFSAGLRPPLRLVADAAAVTP